MITTGTVVCVTKEVAETSEVGGTTVETISLVDIMTGVTSGEMAVLNKAGSLVGVVVSEKGLVLTVENIVGVIVSRVGIAIKDKMLWLQNGNIFWYYFFQNPCKMNFFHYNTMRPYLGRLVQALLGCCL